jgi:GTPase SAR1 family protein
VYETTQSVEYRHRLIETEQYRSKVQLWDCVSSVSKAVTQSIYRGANAIILLYDVTNPSTIDSASDWINEILHYVNQEVLIYLVGSKIDLKERKISLEQGKQLAAKLKLEYWELSSKTGEHVDELFYRIVTDLQEMTVKAMENKEYNIAANEKVRREYLITVDKKEGCCSCCVIS